MITQGINTSQAIKYTEVLAFAKATADTPNATYIDSWEVCDQRAHSVLCNYLSNTIVQCVAHLSTVWKLYSITPGHQCWDHLDLYPEPVTTNHQDSSWAKGFALFLEITQAFQFLFYKL